MGQPIKTFSMQLFTVPSLYSFGKWKTYQHLHYCHGNAHSSSAWRTEKQTDDHMGFLVLVWEKHRNRLMITWAFLSLCEKNTETDWSPHRLSCLCVRKTETDWSPHWLSCLCVRKTQKQTDHHVGFLVCVRKTKTDWSPHRLSCLCVRKTLGVWSTGGGWEADLKLSTQVKKDSTTHETSKLTGFSFWV